MFSLVIIHEKKGVNAHSSVSCRALDFSVQPSFFLVRASPDLASDMPVLFIDPLDPFVAPGDNLTISVKLFNLTNIDLFGFAIGLSWSPTILNYTSHTKTIPVNTYPDGILNDPTLSVLDAVDETLGTYAIVETTAGGPPFNRPGDNSTIFNMTFNAIALGICNLVITTSDLVDATASGVQHHIIDSDVTVIPEFPSMVILPLVMTATLLLVLIQRKKRSTKTCQL